MTQLHLPGCQPHVPTTTHLDLRTYHIILISTSAGKDSQAMMSQVCQAAARAGVLDRVSAVHADLGEMEWPGTTQIAHEQAEHFKIPLTVVSRIGQRAHKTSSMYQEGEAYGDILDYARRRGAWPSPSRRWCTSEFKRGPIEKHMTSLAREYRARFPCHRGPVRILDCIGFRAEESPARARREVLSVRKSTRNQHVDTWLPIHAWRIKQVWEEIHASGAPYHRAYDLGMSRLSCVFCIMASQADLEIAATHNPDLLTRFVDLEQELDHTFQHQRSLNAHRPDIL